MPWDHDSETARRRDPRTARGMRRIGAATRTRRERLGLTQSNVQGMTGIHQSTLSRFERGERCGLRWARFALLVDALGGLDFEPGFERALEHRVFGPAGLHPYTPIARDQLRTLDALVADLHERVAARDRTPASSPVWPEGSSSDPPRSAP